MIASSWIRMRMISRLPCLADVSAGWMLAILWLFGNTIQYGNSECSKLTLGNTMWQSIREGTYTKTSSRCTGRNVYKQNGGTNYLYYIEATGGWKGWMVGTAQCVNSGGMASLDQAMYPEDVTTTWEEVYGGSWYNSYGVTVECYRLSGGIIAGIVIGVLVAVAIIITIIVCCCCCKNKNTNTVQAQHPANVSYINSTANYNRHRPVNQRPQPGYLAGPPAYGTPMVHGYGPPPGPPPTYTSYPPAGATGQPPGGATPYSPGGGTGGMAGSSNGNLDVNNRPLSVPPSYTPNDPYGRGDPFGYATKVAD